MSIPNPQQKADELKTLLEETVTGLGGSNQSYTQLLKYLAHLKVLHTPNVFLPGQIVFFKYKPQNEKFLNSYSPYDMFPLVIITEVHTDGFEGINLHFLSAKWRRQLFDAIVKFLPQKKSGDPSFVRLGANYERMLSPRKFKFFKPCYRRYLKSGFRKRPILIPAEFRDVLVDVDLALFMQGRKVTIRRNAYNEAIKRENNP
jgi:hypothetical protein